MSKELRPDTGDGRSLPCVRCGTSTPDASYQDGLPVCDNCAESPAREVSAVDELIAFVRQLIAFVRQQLAEDERVAREASRGPWAKARADSVYVKETSVVTCPPTPEVNRPEWVGPFDYVVMPDSEGGEGIEPTDATHIVRWDPARVLAEVEAKRRIVDLHHPIDPCDAHDAELHTVPCDTLLALAQPYAGRPGWRTEWSA